VISSLKIRRRGRREGAFTLVELLVTIAIIAILAAVTMAAASRALQMAKTAKCSGNLRAIGIAFQTYLTDNNNVLPQRYYAGQEVGYSGILLPYVGNNPQVFICPSLATPGWPDEPSYGMNWYYDNANIMTVQNQVETILATDTKGPYGTGSNRADQDSGDPGELDPTRHNGEANYLFFDGHVERLTYAATEAPISTGAQGSVNMWGVDQGNHTETLAGSGN
jgi:prepilin-type processing-associated H-X9-DG protein/prepilin-type N-terminal cleavage/methylation domain-containing protein